MTDTIEASGLTLKQEIVACKILTIMVDELTWQERAAVWALVERNGIFCTKCGMGEPTAPNENCQCWNDE
jgi:hypothetical protein